VNFQLSSSYLIDHRAGPSRSVRLDVLRLWITGLHHMLAWLEVATVAERPELAEAILAA
jgi:hypothetical protein